MGTGPMLMILLLIRCVIQGKHPLSPYTSWALTESYGTDFLMLLLLIRAESLL